MKRITLFTILVLVATASVASADRRGGHRSSSGGSHSRSSSHSNSSSHGSYGNRSHGGYNSVGRHQSTGSRGYSTHGRGGQHAAVYQRNGHFRFSNGTSHAYAHPHFTQRYYDYRYAPPTYVESYQPVDGYTWVNGGWRWDGYQWTWSPGYYAAVPAYDY